MSRLAERAAALQEELDKAKAVLEPKEEELATLHAVNARLAEENAELSAAAEAAERSDSVGAADGRTAAALAAAEVRSCPVILCTCKPGSPEDQAYGCGACLCRGAELPCELLHL